MQWSDEAIVLSLRPHGENAAVVQLFTLQQGRHAGLVRSRKSASALCQPGNRVQAQWTGRLPEQLGGYTLEMLHPAASMLLDEPVKLIALSSACALLLATLPEREPVPELYMRVRAFTIDLQHDKLWVMHYLALELELLARLGYGLELSSCAATGSVDKLIYVSPKSGQAVSATGGAPYRDRLLKLPLFLREMAGESPCSRLPTQAEIIDGFRLTSYFLEKHVFAPQRGSMPAARGRLLQQFQESYA